MTDITPPSEAEGLHIGTFWVVNLGQEQGTQPGQRADTDPGQEAHTEPGREQRADTDPFRATEPGREADTEPGQRATDPAREADRPGRGQAPPVPYTDQVVHRLGYGGACPACPRHSHDSIPT